MFDAKKAFEDLLALREGRKRVVYLDSLGKPTVGIGHLVRPADELDVGDEISDLRIDRLFQADSAPAWEIAQEQMKDAGITSEEFLPYLASVCFQLGTRWIRNFPNTWRLIKMGHYQTAAGALRSTEWYRETPTRVDDFAQALRKLPPKKV
jgi:lysozyme